MTVWKAAYIAPVSTQMRCCSARKVAASRADIFTLSGSLTKKYSAPISDQQQSAVRCKEHVLQNARRTVRLDRTWNVLHCVPNKFSVAVQSGHLLDITSMRTDVRDDLFSLSPSLRGVPSLEPTLPLPTRAVNTRELDLVDTR